VIRFVLVLVFLTGSAFGQSSSSDFVLDGSKPFAFLKFDHVGPRKPLGNEEGNLGIWLRVVNNCRFPIRVPTFGDDPGVGVLDQVIVIKPGLVITADVPIEMGPAWNPTIVIDGEGTHIVAEPALPKTKPPAPAIEVENPPEGYWDTMSELHSAARVLPGHDLLFSVPMNHVGPGWFLRVGVFLDVSMPKAGEGPYIELDFSRWQIPPDARTGVIAKPTPGGGPNPIIQK
jgi:hypothetical protein